MIKQEQHSICDVFKHFGSPERNLVASIIGVAIVTRHSRPTVTKRITRQREISAAERFFAETETSTFKDCCDLLGWDIYSIKKAARDPRTASLITSNLIVD